MALRVATVAAFAVLLTLMPATSFGDAREKELVDLIGQLRSALVKEKKAEHKYRTQHDNYHEVRYRLETYNRNKGSHRVSHAVEITRSQQRALENAINDARRNQHASDMYKMRWNDKLAELAQEWSNQCHFTHGTPLFESADLGFSAVGQNNWAFQGPLDPQGVVDDWLAEEKYYDTVTGNCLGGGCSHFKQLVWSTTTDFGCGLTECGSVGHLQKDANLLVCYFGPAGNFEDEEAFKPATRVSGPCSQCAGGHFYCNDDLCDATCTRASSTCVCQASCQNCGTATDDCACKCNAGSVGVDCSSMCADHKSYCKSDYSQLCYLDFVVEMCPKTCGACVSADPCSGKPASSGGAQSPSDDGHAGGDDEPAGGDGPAPAPDHHSSADSGPAPVDPSQNLDNGLTEAQKLRLVYLLNKYRSEAGASNMNKLVWNNQLAYIAQEWSDKCVFKHRDLTTPGGNGYVDPASVGFPTTTLGENIWAFSDNSQVVPDKAVEEWDHEKNYYDFNSATCQPGKDCGHYIANMWAFTREVGCGFTKCSSLQAPGAVWSGGVMLSCNFAGGADMDKQPFQLGQPCTECASGHLYCTHNLCDNSCRSTGDSGVCECNAKCKHGTLAGRCTCDCSHGYMGGQCDAHCDDLAPQCSADWAFTECNEELLTAFGFAFMYEKIVNLCPKLCGRCVEGLGRKVSSHSGRLLGRDSSEEEPQATTESPLPVEGFGHGPVDVFGQAQGQSGHGQGGHKTSSKSGRHLHRDDSSSDEESAAATESPLPAEGFGHGPVDAFGQAQGQGGHGQGAIRGTGNYRISSRTE